jgi:hypothetical protein
MIPITCDRLLIPPQNAEEAAGTLYPFHEHPLRTLALADSKTDNVVGYD